MDKKTLDYIRQNLNHTMAAASSDIHTFRRYEERRITAGMAYKEFMLNNGLKEDLVNENDFLEYISTLGWKRASNWGSFLFLSFMTQVTNIQTNILSLAKGGKMHE